MKTLNELLKEQKKLQRIVHNSGYPYDPREAKNLKKYATRSKFLKDCILFLETSPKFETLKSWLEEAENKLELICDRDRFHTWIKNFKNHDPEKISAGLENEFLREYEKLMEKPKYRN